MELVLNPNRVWPTRSQREHVINPIGGFRGPPGMRKVMDGRKTFVEGALPKDRQRLCIQEFIADDVGDFQGLQPCKEIARPLADIALEQRRGLAEPKLLPCFDCTVEHSVERIVGGFYRRLDPLGETAPDFGQAEIRLRSGKRREIALKLP